METLVTKFPSGEITIDGKVFKYKTSPRELPREWLDLEITNENGDTIKVYFNPKGSAWRNKSHGN